MREAPLRMALKGYSVVNLRANSGTRAWKEEKRSALARDSVVSKASFNKLAAFSNFVGHPMESFEEEIINLLQRLELRKKGMKGEVSRQRLKISILVGSKFERELRNLKCSKFEKEVSHLPNRHILHFRLLQKHHIHLLRPN